MIPDGLLTLRSDGRLLYKAYRGYEQMLYIRAWCGCRQYVEEEEE